MRQGLTIVAAIAVLAWLIPLAGGGAPRTSDPRWSGVGGLVMPLDDTTPVRINLVVLTFTALPPSDRLLRGPEFVEQWEVSTRMELENTSDEPCTLHLALPQVAPIAMTDKPAIDHVVISLDHRRMSIERGETDGPQIAGAPELTFHHRVSVDFTPGQKRRLDTLFRMPGQMEGDVTRMRFVIGGAGRFAGGKAGEARLEWQFGERVRLVPIDGERHPWIASPPAGTEHWFFDDGRRSRLLIGIKEYRPDPVIDLPVAPVGLGPQGAPELIGQLRALDQLSALELKLARWTLLALHGRRFRDPDARRIFEELPWEECNPAFRVAHGIAVSEPSIGEFSRTHPCSADCRERRAEPVDPYGSPFAEPLCWYSPVPTLAQTLVNDADLRDRIRAIEERLRQVDPASMTPPGMRQTQPAPAESGCGCSFAVGSRR